MYHKLPNTNKNSYLSLLIGFDKKDEYLFKFFFAMSSCGSCNSVQLLQRATPC